MATKSGGTDKATAAKKRWHAVSIKSSSSACPAATAAKGQRWLSREAPQLPLPGCTRPDTCRCTYRHHEDRRGEGRRAEDTDAFRRPSAVQVERRSRYDRRKQADE